MEESAEVIEQSPTPSNRSHPTPRPTPPRPPMPYASNDKENVSISNGGTKVTKKLSIGKEKPVAPTANSAEGGNIQLARAGETVLETFYGMLYICEDDTKEWKLAANGFIPLCFIQERGNANNPFKVIAAHGSIRVMEFPVTKDTKCTQNKAFVRWHDLPLKMYGVRFAKESQANQFYSAMFRMKSTLLKTAELFKQPERKAMVDQISDPTVEGVSHTKISLIVKLPNKETTIMSVPGLISIGELLDLICKKENLTRDDHVLTLPKVGGKELKYGSDTVLGSLKIREVFITHVDGSSNNSAVEGNVSSKDPQTSGVRTAQAPPRPHNNHVLPESDKKLEKSLAKSDEHLDQQKKETAKVKRRAPRPPQQPPERPKSMPIPRPRTVASGNEGPPQAKKRQAPARPPAPKVSPRGLDQNKLKTDDKEERLPPEFCPPPPPDDVPPPLDECELPVSPLSADDETAWITSSGDHDSTQNTSSYVTSFKGEESVVPPMASDPPLSPGVSQELASPESIPLKFLLPSEADAENDDVVEREGRSSRINFVGDSRSSSVDFSCDQDIPTSPIEEYRPPIDLQDIEDIKPSNSDKPHGISPPPPPSDFSNEIQDKKSSFDYPGTVPFSETNADIISLQPPPDFDENLKIENSDIESMVVPPPPTMFDDSPEEKDIIPTESNIVLESEESFSIPPPLDFAEDKNYDEEAEEIDEFRDKFGDYDKSTAKKKLGLSTEMFPWLSEPQPAFQAEISNIISDVPPTENNSSSEQQSLVKSEVETNIETTGENDNQELVPQIQPVVESHVNDVENHILPAEIIEKEAANNELHESAPVIESLEDKNEYSGAKYLVSGDESNLTLPNSKDRVPPTAEEKEYRKSISSEEGSSSYRTPFDDLGSVEYSGSSLASESDEDFLDLKNVNNIGNDKTAQAPSDTKIESSNEIETLHQEEKEIPQADVTSKPYSSSLVKESSFTSSYRERSEKSISDEPKVESSTATPIAVPMDILFQSLEQNSTNTETTSLHGNDNKWQQSKTGPKRSVSSGFKKQSWSDIKNQEKLIQEEKQRKSSLTKTDEKSGTSLSTQHDTTRPTELKQLSLDEQAKSTNSSKVSRVSKESENARFETTTPIDVRSSHLKNDNEVTVSEHVSFPNSWAEIKNQEKIMEQERQRKIEIENNASSRDEEKIVVLSDTATTETTTTSSTAANKPKEETRKPHSYVSSAIERRSSSDTSYNVPGRNFVVPAPKRNDMSSFGGSKTTSISGITYTTKEPASNDSTIDATVERVKEQDLSTIPKTNDRQSSSQGVQGVVMRKKDAKQEDTIQKRKSVQDMMKMFSIEDDPERERRDSTEINPRQSPALRLLEEKMGYRERTSSDISSTASETMPKHSIASSATRETNVAQVENSKPKSESTPANNETKPDKVVSKETTKTNSKETDSSSVRLRRNSLNPKPYGVLFPKDQKSSTKVTQSNKSVVESKKETELSLRKSSPNPNSYDILFPRKRSTSDASIETKKTIKSNMTSKTQTENKSDSLVASSKTESIKKDSANSKPPRNTENIEQSKTMKNETEQKKQFEKAIPQTSKVKTTDDQKQPKDNEDIKLVQASSNERKAADNKQVENAPKPVELRKKESIADPMKRYSMPVNLVESSSSSTSSRGKNLKILLAPQISDVDVVPKGRVAAMMAAWKSDDQ